MAASLISCSLSRKQSNRSLTPSFCWRQDSKYVDFLMTVPFLLPMSTGHHARAWLLFSSALLLPTPSCGFVMAMFNAQQSIFSSEQPHNYSKQWQIIWGLSITVPSLSERFVCVWFLELSLLGSVVLLSLRWHGARKWQLFSLAWSKWHCQSVCVCVWIHMA